MPIDWLSSATFAVWFATDDTVSAADRTAIAEVIVDLDERVPSQ